MNTSNTKNVIAIVLVAILSSVVTLLGYNIIGKTTVVVPMHQEM